MSMSHIGGQPGAKAAASKTAHAQKPGAVGVLDVGASKIACFIGRPGPSRRAAIRVTGVGHQSSRGVQAGHIIDLDATEEAVRLAIEQAERMAGTSITKITLNYCGPSLRTQKLRGVAAINGREIRDRDVRRVLKTALGAWSEDERSILHAVPRCYSVDGNSGVRDPRGMFADQLGVELCVVSAERAPLRNLALVVDRCRLDLRSIVASPYAAGLSALVDDEIQLGATVIDMGAGETSFAVFCDGALVHLGVVPLGGNHITRDIARALNTQLRSAERIKTLYGTIFEGPDDDREMIDYPNMCQDPGQRADQTPRAVLIRIIRPRLEEIFEMVRDRIAQGTGHADAGERVVLVGGASQLEGARELAAKILNKQVRLGRPMRMSGLADAVGGAGFAATAGALLHVIAGPREAIFGPKGLPGAAQKGGILPPVHPLMQLWRWLGDNF